MRPIALVTALVGLAALAGCDRNSSNNNAAGSAPRGTPPPPAAAASAAKADSCKGGGGEVKDPATAAFFPKMAGAFCVNPQGETEAFGEKAPKPMEDICKKFDGGCEVYRTHQIKRAVSFDYVDGAGSQATVTVFLSQYATAEQAYTMFSLRVVSDEDPARADMPKKVEVGAPAAMGTGSLYAWKGTYLLELSYVNTEESGDEKKLKASADKALPAIARGIIEKLPGSAALPASVARLPTENQLPLGVSYVTASALGVEGTGGGALGYYREGDRRYRVLVLTKDDPEQAKDVLKGFARRKGAQEEKGVGEAGVRLMIQDGADAPKAEWEIARKGKVVLGVGDDTFAFKPGETAAEHEKVALSRDDKLKKLKALLDAAK
jgi:hypothetical protein